MNALHTAWTAWNIVLAVPVIVFGVEILAAVFLPRARTPAGTPGGVRNTVLVPAHDEERGIAATLRLLREGLRPGDVLLVVADNCTDETATVARGEGAAVLERTDTANRGKSYALDFGIQSLRARPPEVVTIVDADCQIDAASLQLLSGRALATGRPVQALYLMHAPAGTGVRGRIAEFAWCVTNQRTSDASAPIASMVSLAAR